MSFYSITNIASVGLCDIYLQPFKGRASDWLDSCWAGDQCEYILDEWQISVDKFLLIVDWARYGDVMRSIEEVQSILASEVLQLLGKPSDVHIDVPVDLQTPSHLGAGSFVYVNRVRHRLTECQAYATGPFLDACLAAPVKHVEDLLDDAKATYSIPRSTLEASRHRFEIKLASSSERLLRLAANGLSSRVLQKRRAEASEIERYALSTGLIRGADLNAIFAQYIVDE